MGDFMSYRISYNNSVPIGKSRIRFKLRKRVILKAAIMLLICATVLFAINHKDGLVIKYILPGDSEVTERAISIMLNDIKDGRPVKDSVVTFCREIIDNASVQG